MNQMNKMFPIVNGVALVSTIVMNYLSNTGIFNGQTMKSVSDAYFNYFTPAGYAFSIWGLIYLALFAFVFYSGRTLFNSKIQEPLLEKIGWWFAISCIANSVWVVAWLYLYPALAAFIMLIILFSLVRIVFVIQPEMVKSSWKRRLFILFPFSMYVGWISVALIANVAAWLTNMNWNGWGISAEYWTIILIVIAGILNVLVHLKLNLKAYLAVGIWALIAIAVSNIRNDGPQSIVYTCYVISSILFVVLVMSIFKKSIQPTVKR